MFEKMNRILEIAQKDDAYHVWCEIFAESKKKFENYANSQSEEIRTILWSYAQSSAMINQRLLNLACEYMDFADSKESQRMEEK